MTENFNPRMATEDALLEYIVQAIEVGESDRAVAAIRERQAFRDEVRAALPRRRSVRTESTRGDT